MKKLNQPEFPSGLLEIPQPPKELFLEGVLPPPETALLAVVGSRAYSPYGKQACEKIIEGLRGANVAIVSGLALGIDGIAHEAAIRAGLPTIAIPGSGLDRSVLYPRAHVSLAERILKNGGALLSEFSPKERATVYSFPKRNRLMAGTARGVLIIEAAEKSGTLITARLAAEYNRDVFAVPHSLFSENGKGPLRLLKDGAIPVTEADDILKHWRIEKQNQTKKEIPSGALSPEETRMMRLFAEPLARDDAFQKSGMDISDFNILLSIMELKGFITEDAGFIRRV
jgi:DNA processing protein